MFAYIKGSLEMKFKNYLVIDVGGLGYKIFMSENSINTIGDIGTIVKVFTYYRVREDDISIYGFKTQEELRMFELLLSVSGIGAKSALTMLSCVSPSDFAVAVISNNVKLLTQIPGIGTKSAQRIILELKDKLMKTELPKSTSSIPQTQALEDTQAVLLSLGYDEKEIEDALKKIMPSVEDNSNSEEVLRKALTCLSM